MDRRTLLKRLSLATGAVLLGGGYLVTKTMNPDNDPNFTFSTDQKKLLDDILETIIPETDTIGAKRLGLSDMVQDYFRNQAPWIEREGFRKLLSGFNSICKVVKGYYFNEATPSQKEDFLNYLLVEKDNSIAASIYLLATFLYLTSEKGIKENFEYLPVPGKYEGEVDYKPGDKYAVGLTLGNFMFS